MTAKYPLKEIEGQLFTAVLSDVLDSVECTGQVMDPLLRPLATGMRAVGYARTTRAVAVNREPKQPYHNLLKAIDSLTDQDLLIIGMEPQSRSAIFGGLLATAVTGAGGRGVIVDGYVRDSHEIVDLDLPTFARGLMPLDSCGRDEVIEIDTRVSLAGVPVETGDLVFADFDGIVVVPKHLLDHVLDLAFKKVAMESAVRVALRNGMSTLEAFERYGVL